MDKTDDLIRRALAAEDRQLLAHHAEPGYVNQALGLFRGALGWVTWVTYLTGMLAFLGFGFAAWRCGSASEPLAAVQWGVTAIVLFQLSAMTKTYLGSRLEANRLLREIKRVELQVALLRRDASAPHE